MKLLEVHAIWQGHYNYFFKKTSVVIRLFTLLLLFLVFGGTVMKS